MPAPSGPLHWIERMRLQVLLTMDPPGRSAADLARAAIRGGADTIQLREKSLEVPGFLDTAREVQAACQEGGAILVINDRVEAVLPSGARGVHLGQEDMPPGEARRVLGAGVIVGVSCHSLEEALKAEEDGADYVALGCIFPSPTKPHLQPAGTELIGRVADRVRTPIVAIGGIRAENVARVIEAGAQAIAVSSAVNDAPNPESAARRLREAFPNP